MCWETFCTKFTSEQLLFKPFFDVMPIFGTFEPQNKSNFVIFQFCTLCSVGTL